MESLHVTNNPSGSSLPRRFLSPYNHPKPLAQAIRQVLGLPQLPTLPKVK